MTPVLERNSVGRLMLTIGTERAGVRVVRGRLGRRGRFHDWQPCIFLLWRGRRVG